MSPRVAAAPLVYPLHYWNNNGLCCRKSASDDVAGDDVAMRSIEDVPCAPMLPVSARMCNGHRLGVSLFDYGTGFAHCARLFKSPSILHQSIPVSCMLLERSILDAACQSLSM